MNLFLLALFLLAIVAAFGLYWLSRRERARTGLPYNARVVYSDTGAWEKVEKPLYSKQYALAGKPDYLVEQNGVIIPVEVKPSRVSPQPRESDVMQLAAYALLVEETRGTRVPHGLLKYRDQVFQIEFTRELRERLIALMDEMRVNAAAVDVSRHHAEPRRCVACGYRAECGEELQ
jgi:CRISPR-associated exonuclease Cas4